jgi:hypothetical protein
MKQIARTLSTGILLIVLGLVLQHCGGSDPAPPATEAQRVTALMKTGAWKIQAATVDGASQTALFTGLTLTFSDTGFTSTNGEPVWPASGTWAFVNEGATSFTRNDGVVVTIQEISGSAMILSLTWDKTTLGPGRIASVEGQTVLTFGH